MDKGASEFSNEQSLTLEERLQRLREVIGLENSQEKTLWLQARLTEIADAIQEEVANTSPGIKVAGVPEWEELVGGNEEVDFDVTARRYVQELLTVKLTAIEEQLEID